ncbi:MAG: HlyD family secretion protein [Oscillospiraceae bacterium]|nr:HlyD family secretion protein [Oscillospiraceae bacterium]
MRTEIVDFEDLTDSRELLEAKPPKFFMMFSYILITLITVAFIWAYFGRIDIYVSTQGIVRPTEQVSTVINPNSGIINAVYFENGEHVNAGDVLFTLEMGDFDFIIINYESVLADIEVDLENLRRYRESIVLEENLFAHTENLYYTLVERYLTEIQGMQSQMTEQFAQTANQRVDTNLSLESINLAIRQRESEITNLERYIESVRTQTNLFIYGSHYFHLRFLEFERRRNEAITRINEAYRDYNIALENYNATREDYYIEEVDEAELIAARTAWNSAKQSLEHLVSTEILTSEQRITSIHQELAELNISRRRTQNAAQAYNTQNNESWDILFSQTQLQLITEIDSQITTQESRRANIERELSRTIEELEMSELDFIVTAPIDGYLNLLQSVTPGEFVPSGSEIATIIPESQDVLRIELAISNRDIASVYVGQSINFNVLALPYRDYGRVSGVVHSIGADARLNQFTGEMYFLVEAHIANEPVADHRGYLAEIQVGMLVEGQMITDNQRILTWFMNLIWG